MSAPFLATPLPSILHINNLDILAILPSLSTQGLNLGLNTHQRD